MSLNHIHFYTATIQNFKHLLADDNLKMIVIESLQYLVSNKLVTIYGYVIMPNHIHLLWTALSNNGKESPATSFAKYTGHHFKQYLKENNVIGLESYAVDDAHRMYQFWKRDPLAIPMLNETILLQRLEYIHNNPIADKWKLCQFPEQYKFSSASYYSTGKNEFGVVTDFRD